MYITKAQALASGLTHEGTLFGVPAWFAGVEENGVFTATPKFLPLKVWCWLGDKLLDALTYITPADRQLEAPITITRAIA